MRKGDLLLRNREKGEIARDRKRQKETKKEKEGDR